MRPSYRIVSYRIEKKPSYRIDIVSNRKKAYRYSVVLQQLVDGENIVDNEANLQVVSSPAPGGRTAAMWTLTRKIK